MQERFEHKKDKVPDIEAVQMKHVSIIGAGGRFGSRLTKRLETISPHDTGIQPVTDRADNISAASQSGLVILTVRPDQVETTLEHLKPHLSAEAQVVSFAAHEALGRIARIAERPVARFMADPWFQVSAYVLGDRFSKAGLEFMFDRLSTVRPVQLNTNEEIELFTHQISHLFAVLFLQKAGELDNINHHLYYLSALMHIPIEDFKKLRMEDDPHESIRIFATPGGVTEGIIKKLRAQPSIRPEEL